MTNSQSNPASLPSAAGSTALGAVDNAMHSLVDSIETRNAVDASTGNFVATQLRWLLRQPPASAERLA